MTFALGQPVPLTVNIRDTAGALADATAVTLTITKPDDGTSATFTGAQLTHTAPGVYSLDYLPLTPGLFGVRWVATGTNASAPKVDSFYVQPSTLPPLVSLAAAREHLGHSATTADDQLANFAQVASQLAEDHTGMAWRRQTITDTLDGGDRYLQLRFPVISVTTVTEDGSAVAASGYVLDAKRGWLWRAPRDACWSALAPQNIGAVYVAGPAGGLIPEPIQQGVLEMVRHLWETQRGASGAPRRGPGTEWAPGSGFSVPRRVEELWEAAMPPGMA